MWRCLLLAFCVAHGVRAQDDGVIVVGAGMAGVAAANELARRGRKVTLIEAQNRPGGRMRTLPQFHPGGFAGYDMGAAWVHGWSPQNPLWQAMQRYNLTAIPTPLETLLTQFFNPSGVLYSAADVRRSWLDFDEFDDRLWDFADHRRRTGRGDLPLCESIPQVIADWRPRPTPVRLELLAWQIAHIIESDEGGFLCDYSTFSFCYGDWDYFPGGDAIISGPGYRQLTDAMMAEIPADSYKNNQHVYEIDYSGTTGVTVRARNMYGDEFTYTGSAVIVTVSIAVLKGIEGSNQPCGPRTSGGGLFYPPFNQPNSITFRPALPQAKTNAIAVTGMGVYNILLVLYESSVLPRNLWVFANVQPGLDDLGSNFSQSVRARLTSLGKLDLAQRISTENKQLRTHIFYNNEYEGKLTSVSMHIGGDWGLIFEEFSDWELTEILHDVLRRTFNVRQEPIAGIATRWSQDMATGGSYSYPRMGRQILGLHPTDTYDIMAAPVGNNRVLFAGEGTSRTMWQSVQGALTSGLREAGRLTGDWSAYETAMSGAVRGRKLDRKKHLMRAAAAAAAAAAA